MRTETRYEQIARWEATGLLDPNCAACQRDYYAATDKTPADVFAPRHRARPGCQSGSAPHCTCDTCF